MNKKRPINLDLRTIQFPAMAIASILHRVSGVVLFLLFPWILYLLRRSLNSPESFLQLQELFHQPLIKLMLWAFCSALIYHVLAGIRHLIMDLGYGEEVHQGRRSAIFVITLTVILTLLLGLWI